MQKKIIALAIAGLVSGAAFAQSNVVIYGTASAYYGYSKGDTNKFSGIQSDAMTLGFKGEEALGNGLKAIFKLEFGGDIDGGTNAFGKTRTSYVGVDTSMGSFTLGKQDAPSRTGALAKASSNGVSWNSASDDIWGDIVDGIGGTMTTGDSARWNNSVAFQSKDYSGFSSRVIYSFGEAGGGMTDRGASRDAGKFGISGNYQNDPLNVDVVYQTKLKNAVYNQKDTSVPNFAVIDGAKSDEWFIGAGYDFKVVKIMGGYQNTSTKGFVTGINDSKAKADLWMVGAVVPVSAQGNVLLEYAGAQVKNVFGDNKAKVDAFSVAYTHNLSKRTKLYTQASYFKNNEYSWVNGQMNTGTADHSNWSFATGVEHNF